MSKSNKNSNKKSMNNGFRKNNKNSHSIASSICTMRFREYSVRVTQTTSGTGGLTTTSNTSQSLTASSGFVFTPYSIGGRLQYLAQIFLRWKILKLRAVYTPTFTTASGVVESVSGATTTPSYVSRPFAWGLFGDPLLSGSTYSGIETAGGMAGNTARSMTLNWLPETDTWYYTTTTTSSPTSIDLRMTTPVELRFSYLNASTTSTASYGDIVFEITAAFRDPVYPTTLLGLAIPQNTSSLTPSTLNDEKKEDGSKSESNKQQSVGFWFSK